MAEILADIEHELASSGDLGWLATEERSYPIPFNDSDGTQCVTIETDLEPCDAVIYDGSKWHDCEREDRHTGDHRK